MVDLDTQGSVYPDQSDFEMRLFLHFDIAIAIMDRLNLPEKMLWISINFLWTQLLKWHQTFNFQSCLKHLKISQSWSIPLGGKKP